MRRSLILGSILAVGAAGWSAAEAQPLLNQALCATYPTPGAGAGVPTAGGMVQWGGSGQPLVKVELTAPGAVCNDGTPGAMYLRPAPPSVAGAPNPAANHWIIHFKGGGGCRSFLSCRARWCADQPPILNDPGLMSTAGAHLEAAGTGILSQNPANPFRAWNHVLLFYCSSDAWVGDQRMGMAVSPDPAADAGHEHRIAFKGVAIARTAFERLLSPLPVILPNGSGTQMPLLRDADLVLLSGDSAGANGARAHADWAAAAMRDVNVPLGNNLPVLLTLDAGAAPLFDGGALPWPTGPPPPPFPSYADFMADAVADQTGFIGLDPSNLDQSCVAMAANPDTCYDHRYVQQNHVTTPMFQRNDLLDTVANGVFVEQGLAPSTAAYVGATAQDLVAIQPAGVEPRPPIAAFGPFCSEHVSILNTVQFLGQQAVAGGLTYATALAQWVQACVAGACPAYSEIAPPAGGQGFVCP